jgi:hypothetical protein
MKKQKPLPETGWIGEIKPFLLFAYEPDSPIEGDVPVSYT